MCCRLAEVDDFISNLWDVHLAVEREGYVQVWLLPLIQPKIGYVLRPHRTCR